MWWMRLARGLAFLWLASLMMKRPTLRVPAGGFAVAGLVLARLFADARPRP